MSAVADNGFWTMPIFLLGLCGVPVLVFWVWLWSKQHMRVLRTRFTGTLLERVLPRSVRWRRALRNTSLLMAVTLSLIALAEPRYGKRVHLFAQKGVDMVLVLDLSSSMDARDVDPSRLERARREVEDLVALLGGDRVGLVIYAGGAYPRMPLTQDHDALKMLVSEVSTQDFQIQGTALGEAIEESIKLLTNDDTSTAGKAIFVLSDGEVHNIQSVLTAAQHAAEERIQIYSLQVGTEPSPIPLQNGGYLRDAQGEVVMTRPTPDVLVELARMTGGAFHESEASDNDVRALYLDGIQRSLEVGLTGERQEISWQSGYQWPLGFAVLFGLFAAWLGEGRRLWGAAAAFLFFSSIISTQPTYAGSVAEGDSAYRMGNYQEAERIFSELLMMQPTDSDLYGRLGATRYRSGDYDGAARAFQRQSELDGGTNPESLFNLGNAYFQSGRLQDAIEQYDAALSLEKEHPGAQRNRGLAQSEMEARRAIQPPPPEQNQEQEGADENASDEPQEGQNQQGTSGQQQQESKNKGDNQKGDDEKGDQQEGSSGSGDTQEGQQSQQQGDGQEPTQQSSGQKSPSDNQEREDSEEVGGVNPDELGGEGAEESQGSGTSSDGERLKEGELSEDAAKELLDSVEEGRPRVVIPGRSEGKPW